jgi:ATP-dependent Lon protease
MVIPKSPNNKNKIMTTSEERITRRKRIVESSSESDNDGGDDENCSGSESESENSEDYRKLIAKLFPSKYMKRRVKEINESKKSAKKAIKEDLEEQEKDTNKHKKNKNKKSKKIVKEESEEDDDEEEEEEEEDERILRKVKEAKKNFNIIFTISDKGGDYEDDEDYDSDEDSDYDEEDDEDYDSDEYEEEDDDDDDEDEDEEEEEEYVRPKTRGSKKAGAKEESMNQEDMDKSFKLLKEQLGKLSSDNPKNAVYKSCLEDLEAREKEEQKKLRKTQRKERMKNFHNFRKVVKNKGVLNDFSYFKDRLTLAEQKKVLREVEEINKITNTEKPYRLSLLESSIPTPLKAVAMSKISALRYMEPGQGEYYKVKNWVDTFMQIPFNTYKQLPITYDAGVEKCHDFMESAKTTLDEATYGMNDAKMQIMQMVGQWITNPSAVGTAIAIKGPMGTGKTTLIKEGISKILGRDFAFIALGGATDSSFLEGHSYTYEGSTWGKIVDILIKSKSMNPVIYFDELDKISDTPKGEEIAGILTHLTDTSQNSAFHDKYFSEVDFDLSKCLFIFSYNDESKVNPILLDRMYKIQTDGYERKDKLVIVNKYLLPKILDQISFKSDDIVFPDDTLVHIIDNYTNEEKGVRNLKRCLEIICTKLNLYRLMKPGSKMYNDDVFEVNFPYSVSVETVKKLVKSPDNLRAEIMKSLYV